MRMRDVGVQEWGRLGGAWCSGDERAGWERDMVVMEKIGRGPVSDQN